MSVAVKESDECGCVKCLGETINDTAIRLCRENGEDPFGYLDYADLRNDKQRYEHFLNRAKSLHGVDT